MRDMRGWLFRDAGSAQPRVMGQAVDCPEYSNPGAGRALPIREHLFVQCKGIAKTGPRDELRRKERGPRRVDHLAMEPVMKNG